MPEKPPAFCDFHCPHADFPPADTAGICHTMSAVWCKQLKELVYKNMPCEWTRRGKSGKSKAAGRSKGTPRQRRDSKTRGRTRR